MANEHDLVIRGGTILDGSGGDPFTGDVAVSGGLIREVGKVSGTGREEINATGKLVMPGFVDIHTHFDGQATWSNRLKPSTQHGVTTVVMGNCGVGFAPCRPEERTMLVKVMEGVEDIPELVMTEGIPWQWQTFPEYLDFLSNREFDADCAVYVPHSAVRVYVMGARGGAGEPSTPEDRARMSELVTEAIKAGAIGVSTSRALFHRDAYGNLAPHVRAGREELLALAEGLRRAGKGIFQFAPGIFNQQLKHLVPDEVPLTQQEHAKAEVALMREVAEVAGRPVTFALADLPSAPGMYRQILDLVAECNKAGIEMKAQIFPRPIGILFGLELSLNPFTLHPSYHAIADLPLPERLAKMRTPEFRARILSEKSDPKLALSPVHQLMVENSLSGYHFTGEADYEPNPAKSLKADAKRRGVDVLEVAFDALVGGDGLSMIILPQNNFVGETLDNVHDMLTDDGTVLGLGDGGAHYGTICDASYPTFLLTYWARDRVRAKISLPAVVHRMTRRGALTVGLDDRGLIAPGLRADINIIDHDKLHLHAPNVVRDLPAGGRRLSQLAGGYVANIVKGEVTYRDGVATGALPGRVIRTYSASTAQRKTA